MVLTDSGRVGGRKGRGAVIQLTVPVREEDRETTELSTPWDPCTPGIREACKKRVPHFFALYVVHYPWFFL